MRKEKIVALEIVILIVATISMSYFIDKIDNKDTNLERMIGKTFDFIIPGSLVSAAELGKYTCLQDKNGSYCQEYSSTICDSQCSTSCIPTSRDQVSECKIGTCYDSDEGTCSVKSPKGLCENQGGKWFDDPDGNIAECKRGCCLIGDNALFVTGQQCNKSSINLGTKSLFKPEVNTEASCLALAKNQEEGACVIPQGEENGCKFTTKSDCMAREGQFYSGYLCSNPELNTTCIKQSTVKCADGKDEVYWYDSCGNRENIYDSNKAKSWNSGKILSKLDSCSLGTTSNPFSNQKTCGNCNYASGSICGLKTSSEKLSGGYDYVCKDLSCVDENGKARKNGESWCEYQGAIGVDNNRAADTVGSRDFRVTCIDGEVRTEACTDYRNEICVEQKTPIGKGTFSSAACRINNWQLCLSYNEEGKKDECTKNPDCFLKNVKVGKTFEFSVCTPKYPAGFDLKDNGESSGAICSLASQKCTVVYQKGFGGWKCKQNCECAKSTFAEQMNNLCISLGDCGTKVNYKGDLTVNSEVYKSGSKIADPFTAAYLNGLKKYSNPIPGKSADPGNFSYIFGFPQSIDDSGSGGGGGFDLTTLLGVGGLALGIYALKGTTVGNVIFGAISHPYGAAAAGAGVVIILTKLLGLNLPPTELYTLATLGAVSGFGISIYGFQSWAGTLGIVVIVILVILKILGYGKTKKVVYEFKCSPWQPPIGNVNCAKCGADGKPCSEYSCRSLGMGCELINQGTSKEECVDINPNDVSAPLIKPLSVEGFDYLNISDNGFSVKGEDECVKAYSNISFGVGLNEPGQCRIDSQHTSKFEDMSEYLGGNSLFTINHTMSFIVPSLESLGIPGYDPTRKTDYSIYVRCRDNKGNSNINEYAINFCVKPGDDLTAPSITKHIPENQYVAWNATNVNISVFTNEPSECKWDYNENAKYNEMQNTMICANGLDDQTLYGWECDSNVDVRGNLTNAYVRCKDQPWLVESVNGSQAYIVVEDGPTDAEIEKANSEEETTITGSEETTTRQIPVSNDRKRNVNTESYKITLTKSSSNLKIDSISPNNETLLYGTPLASVKLEAKTSGGVNGDAQCFYLFGNQYISFADTFQRTHTQLFNSMTTGNYNIPITCVDIAGNSINGNSKFEIRLDNEAPVITRAYNKGGNLHIVTNEESTCVFTEEIPKKTYACSFAWENATLMSGDSFDHTTTFNAKNNYFIRCKDKFENTVGGCQMVVRGGI